MATQEEQDRLDAELRINDGRWRCNISAAEEAALLREEVVRQFVEIRSLQREIGRVWSFVNPDAIGLQ